MQKIFLIMMTTATLCAGCCDKEKQTEFDYNVEKFADLGVLRYQVTDWDSLSAQQKAYIYCLQEAALWGRDILFDQNNRYNLAIRRTLEAIYATYKGDTATDDYKAFEVYTKRVWFSNGIHHHYGEEKFLPEFSQTFFIDAVCELAPEQLPTRQGQSVDAFLKEIVPVMFDPNVMAKKVNQDPTVDVIVASANNYYGDGVTATEVEKYYGAMKNPKDLSPVAYGLNSRLVKKDGKLVEEVYKVGGLYSAGIEKVVHWLNEAQKYAENEAQKQATAKLIAFYNTGSLKTYDEYAIAWVQDTESLVDYVNGFTESYGDALGIKASWEAMVNFQDIRLTKSVKILSENAQWFENNSPVAQQFKKEKVKGISAKAITAATLGGDCYPTTPIGINLPNSNWIRKEYGSKSVTVTNITEAYDKAAAGSGFADEFVCCPEEKKRMEDYGSVTDNLHTSMHECLGHASGQLLPGVDPDALKAYGSTWEEARADLFALYYIADPKVVELGLLPNMDAHKAEYYKFVMNGLMTQLSRIEEGKSIEEAHMRNRAMIAHWVLDHGKAENVVELLQENGKTVVVVHDYAKLRNLFGQLLAEVQRVKSTGDYQTAQTLVEAYGVKVDPTLHAEVRARYKKLKIAPYKGFINPVYEATHDKEGNITDVKVSYTEGYAEQHLRYSKDYSVLPTYND
ncbi:dipeptidyl-peptidase 3 family protein [Candidatus Symbiothrix dinenymphae]|uniref:dipeptidyl-peptidase 3 family protein n=1 Tax=Candidatus Symbiothrix dinenymphae TaxID=467085 RepID=UPI0006C02457|nr:peptidase family M49 [Candidatus Symbiothrix dinenymphae]